jgi:hypothetical protein
MPEKLPDIVSSLNFPTLLKPRISLIKRITMRIIRTRYALGSSKNFTNGRKRPTRSTYGRFACKEFYEFWLRSQLVKLVASLDAFVKCWSA